MSKIKRWVRSKKFWKRFTLFLFGVPITLFFIVVMVLYVKQDAIVQGLLKDLNKDFTGEIEIADSHISMFENFPYISIDLEHFRVHESKNGDQFNILNIDDAYVGFDLWTILTGEMDIKKIKLKGGEINLVQHEDGEFNIVKALTAKVEIESAEEEFHLDLKKIKLENIDITKLNEANNLKIEAFVNDAEAKFETNEDHVIAALDARFVMNVIQDGDTTFFRHKHIDVDTELDFLKGDDILTIQPTTVEFEGSDFNMEGSIDFLDDANIDIQFDGNKPNFELFIAMAPEELIPTLREYENQGNIYLEASINGKSINGHNPAIEAKFGCKEGYFKNQSTNSELADLFFNGYFTNGEDRNISTMEFGMHNVKAKPELGDFTADVVVKNFNAPEVDLEIETNFEMEFISKFLDFQHLHDIKGNASVEIDYADVIDMDNPEHTLSQLNEQYKMKIKLEDFSFISDYYDIPVKNLNLITEIEEHKATIELFDVKVGNSDLTISGVIDDLPAIIHHTDIPVDTRLKIESKLIDLYELTGSNENSIDEQLENVSLDLDFKSSAKSFTESAYLPVGEFFIENFYAKMKNYPHTLHDFHADILIDERDMRVVDFKGMIDKSDFLFTGKLEHYEKWLDEHPGGDSRIEFDLASNLLQLESVFTYHGDQYVPEEYRHEEFDNLHIHGFTYLHYDEVLKSMDLTIDKFQAKMKVHPLRFENFNGRVHYEDKHLVIEDFQGILGKSNFKTNLHYYFGENVEERKRSNHLSISSTRLDMDKLLKYNPAPVIANHKNGQNKTKIDHDKGFNIYKLPFTDMTFEINIDHLNYHRYLIHNFNSQFRITPDHYIHIDQMQMDASGGSFDIKGYFNGSNPDKIYFSPDIYAENIDLDKLLIKFDNFGQDHIVAENLHGNFTGGLTGKIHMHNDLVPKIDDSEIHLDAHVVNGRLENYPLLDYMTDYFRDKDLNQVRFDTLDNHIDLTNGVLTIPSMAINSTLGHVEISGKQSLEGEMEYYLRIPWKMVTQAAASKLFGKGKKDKEEDEIISGTDKTKYVNLKIVSDENGYKFSLKKKKKERS